MDSTDISEMLLIIAEETSKNNKILLLKEFLEDEDFKKVLKYAYDPFITFGILETPVVESSKGVFSDKTWDILDMLKDRELTGNSAKEIIKEELSELNLESQELFKQILKKDLRAGFNAISINKACPGLIPKIPYMRCSLPKDVKLNTWDWESGVFSQEKADGMFVNIFMNKQPVMTTRTGKVFPNNFSELSSDLKKCLKNGYQYHGELTIYEDGNVLSRRVGNGILNRLLQGGTLPEQLNICFSMWDMIPKQVVDTELEYISPYNQRFFLLQQHYMTNFVKIIDTHVVFSYEEALQHFKELVSRNCEGTILKEPHGIWKNGVSKSQVKMKIEKNCELRVIGYIPGKGKNEDTFGSLICTSEDGDLEVNVSGFTDAERRQIWGDPAHWRDEIICVKYNEVIENKTSDKFSLFLPVYLERRLDKLTANSTIEIINQ